MLSRRTLAVVGWVYVLEGFPMGVFRDVWPVYLRRMDVDLAWIGLQSGLYLAWSLKLLWSPLVDRFGERRQWIGGALACMALALVAVPTLAPREHALALLALMGVFCVASATQDVAIDAYTIGLVPRGGEGEANGVRIAAYRIAMLAGGGGLVWLAAATDWRTVHAVAALAALAMAVSLRACPRVAVPLAARKDVRAAFGSWRRRAGFAGVLLFVLLYRLGDLAMTPMLKPFWVDAGLSDREIAAVATAGGSLATMAGAALGAALVTRIGIGRSLGVLGVFALASNLGYAAAALPGAGRLAIYAASLLESACGGLAAAGFLSFLMRICDRDHAAVQYATLTSLYALPGTLGGVVSGWAVGRLGYATFFALTALVALPAFAFLPAARRWLDAEEAGA